MNQSKEVVYTGGIGIGGLAFVVLLILKLTGNIGMSWFAVITSILWAPFLASFVVFCFFGVFFIIIFLIGVFGIILQSISRR